MGNMFGISVTGKWPLGVVQQIIVVASPNVQDTKLRCFDERKLKLLTAVEHSACTDFEGIQL